MTKNKESRKTFLEQMLFLVEKTAKERLRSVEWKKLDAKTMTLSYFDPPVLR